MAALDHGFRAEVPQGLQQRTDELAKLWLAAELEECHPLRAVLESEGTLEQVAGTWSEQSPGTPLRSVLASHPYAGMRAWSHRRMFRESSSTRRG
ncbi:MAG: hypothetical protein AB2A00_39640 [Myxococcota bacterium]